MLGQTFYHQTLRKYVIVFGTLFNDINLEKRDGSDNVVSRQKVPIAYGPKQKFIRRIRQDPNLDRQVAISLPRMSFEMTAMVYDPVRKLNSVGTIKNIATSTGGFNTMRKMFNPVPYTMDFQLSIYVDNAEDGTQILEQILPFFTPEFNVTLNVIPDMNLKLDVPIILNGASLDDTYDSDFETRRTLIWTLDFFVKGFIYPDIKSSDKIIRKVMVDFRNYNELGPIPELDRMRLESSSITSDDYLTLEDNRYFLMETGGHQGDTISRITVTTEGGESAVVSANDDVDANTTITIFNPPVFTDLSTGTDS